MTNFLPYLVVYYKKDDSSASKALLVLLLSLTSQVKNSSALVRDLAQDIHSQLGDIDQVCIDILSLCWALPKVFFSCKWRLQKDR